MKKFILLLFAFPFLSLHAQDFNNGAFNSTSSGWGCSPEANNVETTYGGFVSSNRVAEIDAAAGLCQTISGFTIGATYTLLFDCSRRTTCGPTLQTLNLTVSGGALSRSVSRNGTAFNFQQESFDFVATATSHTITLAGTSAGTCGLIVDNFRISAAPLPVELTTFEGHVINQSSIELFWGTESETNNDYFLIEHSSNGLDWEALTTVDGAGNSTAALEYTTIDPNPFNGNNYYRLKQVDFDGSFEYSKIIVINFDALYDYPKVTVFPIPAIRELTITGSTDELSVIRIYNAQGQDVTNSIFVRAAASSNSIDVSNLEAGMYIIKTKYSTRKFLKQ